MSLEKNIYKLWSSYEQVPFAGELFPITPAIVRVYYGRPTRDDWKEYIDTVPNAAEKISNNAFLYKSHCESKLN